MPLPAGISACTPTALACSMVTEPVAVTTFPMGAVSRSPAEGCAGLFCARATTGTIADSITAATNTAIACARMGFHSLKVKVFINTLVLAELTHSYSGNYHTLVLSEQQACFLRFQASTTSLSFPGTYGYLHLNL